MATDEPNRNDEARRLIEGAFGESERNGRIFMDDLQEKVSAFGKVARGFYAEGLDEPTAIRMVVLVHLVYNLGHEDVLQFMARLEELGFFQDMEPVWRGEIRRADPEGD